MRTTIALIILMIAVPVWGEVLTFTRTGPYDPCVIYKLFTAEENTSDLIAAGKFPKGFRFCAYFKNIGSFYSRPCQDNDAVYVLPEPKQEDLPDNHAVESPPIKQWEYTVVCNAGDEAQQVVDEKSGAGWELISVTYGPPPGSFIHSVYYCYHFKRPKQVKP
ncbi:MAG TPA: hypothetical protein ENI07_13570 [Desulfobacterales bacterium]|nr:hypothetical protein [Desulfobacterales bacterium]